MILGGISPQGAILIDIFEFGPLLLIGIAWIITLRRGRRPNVALLCGSVGSIVLLLICFGRQIPQRAVEFVAYGDMMLGGVCTILATRGREPARLLLAVAGLLLFFGCLVLAGMAAH